MMDSHSNERAPRRRGPSPVKMPATAFHPPRTMPNTESMSDEK
ncbi:hypothetical protein [Lysobacter gummosus]